MFREIELNPKERDLHRFIIRDTLGKLVDCRMRRVTFGVRCSPFLATQVIRDLAYKHSESHPEASHAILRDFYVDDYISGTNTLEDAVHLRQQLCNLLQMAQMTLRKWRTNDESLRATIPNHLIEMEDLQLTNPETSLKTLGIHCSVITDAFHVSTPDVIPAKVTKRTIASVVCKVFDVLGLFSPITILAKLLL